MNISIKLEIKTWKFLLYGQGWIEEWNFADYFTFEDISYVGGFPKPRQLDFLCVALARKSSHLYFMRHNFCMVV